ncbi:MAG: branched-chain amino acid ABC transporter permease [Chloroflexota bacterium]
MMHVVLVASHGLSSNDMSSFLLYTMNGLTAAALYFLVASGFTLIFGLMRVVNLAHGSLYLLGAYWGWSLADASGSWWLGLLGAAVGVGGAGVVMQQLFLRPIQGQDLRQALVTIGISIIVADQLLAHYGGLTYEFTVPDAINGGTDLHLYSLIYPTFRLFVLACAVAIGVGLWLVLNRTKLGIIVRAAIDDRAMVSALGINIQVIFALLFFMGAMLAGLAGLIGGSALSISTGEDARYLLASLIVVIIGGMGSLEGAAIGALLVGLVESYGLAYAPTYTEILIFAMMVVVLAIRPQGFLGRPA